MGSRGEVWLLMVLGSWCVAYGAAWAVAKVILLAVGR